MIDKSSIVTSAYAFVYLVPFTVALVWGIAACASGSSSENISNSPGGQGTGGSDADGDGDSDGSGDTDIDGDGDADSDADSDETCAEVSETAEAEKAPADIVFIVDNSGSMLTEAAMVENNMNKFSSQIVASGVDAHVALVSGAGTGIGGTGIGGNGVCIDAPLGSGQCPADSNLPGYRHVAIQVGSNDSLMLLRSTYPQWKQSLRAGAALHFVVVSDDDSLYMPAAA